MISLFKNLFSRETLDYADLLERGALIIDVRSAAEFAGGHVKGSVNIPLGEIQMHVREVKHEGKPVIACCRSGARSGSATDLLKRAGIEAYNGGSWNEVEKNIKR